MERRTRDAAAWGLVGALAFLVLVQGYNAVGGRVPSWLAVVAIAVVVAAAVTGLAYAAAKRRV